MVAVLTDEQKRKCRDHFIVWKGRRQWYYIEPIRSGSKRGTLAYKRSYNLQQMVRITKPLIQIEFRDIINCYFLWKLNSSGGRQDFVSFTKNEFEQNLKINNSKLYAKVYGTKEGITKRNSLETSPSIDERKKTEHHDAGNKYHGSVKVAKSEPVGVAIPVATNSSYGNRAMSSPMGSVQIVTGSKATISERGGRGGSSSTNVEVAGNQAMSCRTEKDHSAKKDPKARVSGGSANHTTSRPVVRQDLKDHPEYKKLAQELRQLEIERHERERQDVKYANDIKSSKECLKKVKDEVATVERSVADILKEATQSLGGVRVQVQRREGRTVKWRHATVKGVTEKDKLRIQYDDARVSPMQHSKSKTDVVKIETTRTAPLNVVVWNDRHSYRGCLVKFVPKTWTRGPQARVYNPETQKTNMHPICEIEVVGFPKRVRIGGYMNEAQIAHQVLGPREIKYNVVKAGSVELAQVYDSQIFESYEPDGKAKMIREVEGRIHELNDGIKKASSEIHSQEKVLRKCVATLKERKELYDKVIDSLRGKEKLLKHTCDLEDQKISRRAELTKLKNEYRDLKGKDEMSKKPKTPGMDQKTDTTFLDEWTKFAFNTRSGETNVKGYMGDDCDEKVETEKLKRMRKVATSVQRTVSQRCKKWIKRCHDEGLQGNGKWKDEVKLEEVVRTSTIDVASAGPCELRFLESFASFVAKMTAWKELCQECSDFELEWMDIGKSKAFNAKEHKSLRIGSTKLSRCVVVLPAVRRVGQKVGAVDFQALVLCRDRKRRGKGRSSAAGGRVPGV